MAHGAGEGQLSVAHKTQRCTPGQAHDRRQDKAYNKAAQQRQEEFVSRADCMPRGELTLCPSTTPAIPRMEKISAQEISSRGTPAPLGKDDFSDGLYASRLRNIHAVFS